MRVRRRVGKRILSQYYSCLRRLEPLYCSYVTGSNASMLAVRPTQAGADHFRGHIEQAVLLWPQHRQPRLVLG